MKRKIIFLISALCALGACASFTACLTDSQNGNDENIEKTRSTAPIVEQQQDEENGGCPDGNCPEQNPEKPNMENMPPMPEFRFMPHPEHMPNPANSEENSENKNKNVDTDNNDADDDGDSENPEEHKKPPMPAPHRGGKIKPKMPKTGK